MERLIKLRAGSLRKVNKIDKPLVKLIKKKRRPKSIKSKIKKGEVTSNITEIVFLTTSVW